MFSFGDNLTAFTNHYSTRRRSTKGNDDNHLYSNQNARL